MSLALVDNPINKFWKDDVPASRWQNEKWRSTKAKGKIVIFVMMPIPDTLDVNGMKIELATIKYYYSL